MRLGAPPGSLPDGSYITPEGERLTIQVDQATYLRTVQDWIVTPLLKNTGGLAGIDAIGGYVKQYQVVPDVQRLAALRLSLNDLASALEENNTGVGAGVVERNDEGLAVRSDARIADASELAHTVVATREGVPILLSQVATVKTGDPHGIGIGKRPRGRRRHRGHAHRREQSLRRIGRLPGVPAPAR